MEVRICNFVTVLVKPTDAHRSCDPMRRRRMRRRRGERKGGGEEK